MTMRRQMLVAAGGAAAVEPPDHVDYLRRCQCADGGFADRAGDSDLYYTVFGLESLGVLGAADAAVRSKARSFLESARLTDATDLVELSSYARCWVSLGDVSPAVRDDVLGRLEAFRCATGGYAQIPGAARSNLFGTFIAMGLLEDLEAPLPDDEIVDCIGAMRCESGGYAADAEWLVPSVPSTAAAACMLHSLGERLDDAAAAWLLGQQFDGAFRAVEGAPVGDLLSTGVSLHALQLLGVDCSELAGPCRAFVNSMRAEGGGFRGTIFDNQPDCEYTFYGLIARGELERI